MGFEIIQMAGEWKEFGFTHIISDPDIFRDEKKLDIYYCGERCDGRGGGAPFWGRLLSGIKCHPSFAKQNCVRFRTTLIFCFSDLKLDAVILDISFSF